MKTVSSLIHETLWLVRSQVRSKACLMSVETSSAHIGILLDARRRVPPRSIVVDTACVDAVCCNVAMEV